MTVISPEGLPAHYQSLPVMAITIPAHRLRQLQSEIVADLAASIAALGLLQPIVNSVERRERYRLIAGRHRLEAIRQLGRDAIYARIVSGIDAAAAELMEIDENLIRAELSPAEHALHIGRRKQLYEELHPETKQGGAPGKAGGGKKAKPAKVATFAKDTATKAGKSRRAVVSGHFGEIRATMLAADLCFTTTDELAYYMRGAGKTAHVMPNGFDQVIHDTSRAARLHWQRTKDDTFIRIGYAGGSRTHQRDFGLAVEAIARLLRENNACRLVLFRTSDGSEKSDRRRGIPRPRWPGRPYRMAASPAACQAGI